MAFGLVDQRRGLWGRQRWADVEARGALSIDAEEVILDYRHLLGDS
jgi:hypothetical protein